MTNQKLTICFNPWMIVHENDNYDDVVGQIAERGFNCIRIEDGAGLLWDKDGNVREDISIFSPFGKFSKYTTYCVIPEKSRMNLLDRLLKICKAAKKHNVKLILSSWFFLHTNWFCEEEIVKPVFDLSTEEKMSFFGDELSRILDLLKQENLIDVVAFAEIFNEFDGLPFVGEYKGVDNDKALKMRDLHEAEIEKLKNKHPDILFALDVYTPWVNENIVPRNIDVFNFHSYYLWDIYIKMFEKGLVKWSLEELEIPEETRYFLKDEIITVKEIAEEMGHDIKTGLDWPRRISLYASIDESKMDELSTLLDNGLKENIEDYRNNFRKAIDNAISVHDRVVPDSKIVMGEGLTYCASPTLTFERDSEYFWQLAMEQMAYFNEKGFWGSVIATTHAPERVAAWGPCKDLYIKANKIFCEGK